MATQVQASVLHGAKDLRIETRSLPAPEPDEVQVQIASTGLCGSDLHYYTHFRNGDILVREPLSLGHESSGVVVDVGSAVTNLKPGDRVALEVGLPCSSCTRCSEGRYNLCPEMRFRSSGKAFPHFQGTLQQRINHPARWCYPLPESLSLDVGALLEPLGVALHSFRRSQLPVAAPGSTAPRVLIFGAGAVGLLCAAVAKLRGGATVTIADIDAGRVDWAVSHGFAHHSYVVPLRRGADIDANLAIAKETAASLSAIGESTSVGEYDAVFECTGVPSCVQASIYATRPGGRVVLVGMGHPVQTLPLGAAALREVDLVGSFRYANTYPDGIAMLEAAAEARKAADTEAANVPDFAGLVTHRFNGLQEAEKAFAIAGKSVDSEGRLVLKVVIDSREVATTPQK